MASNKFIFYSFLFALLVFFVLSSHLLFFFAFSSFFFLFLCSFTASIFFFFFISWLLLIVNHASHTFWLLYHSKKNFNFVFTTISNVSVLSFLFLHGGFVGFSLLFVCFVFWYTYHFVLNCAIFLLSYNTSRNHAHTTSRVPSCYPSKRFLQN